MISTLIYGNVKWDPEQEVDRYMEKMGTVTKTKTKSFKGHVSERPYRIRGIMTGINQFPVCSSVTLKQN
jgi:hypothetical protein